MYCGQKESHKNRYVFEKRHNRLAAFRTTYKQASRKKNTPLHPVPRSKLFGGFASENLGLPLENG
jgi:hypothetical protein